MRALIQRVSHASVTINEQVKSSIQQGLLVLIGIEHNDTDEDSDWLTSKIVKLRIFDDENGIMNKSLLDINGELLVVSQFTLQATTAKGNRPSYIRAAKPEVSIPLYETFCKIASEKLKKPVETGQFGADMKVELMNDGPVTIWMDSKIRE